MLAFTLVILLDVSRKENLKKGEILNRNLSVWTFQSGIPHLPTNHLGSKDIKGTSFNFPNLQPSNTIFPSDY